jgi:hypothetical protein
LAHCIHRRRAAGEERGKYAIRNGETARNEKQNIVASK